MLPENGGPANKKRRLDWALYLIAGTGLLCSSAYGQSLQEQFTIGVWQPAGWAAGGANIDSSFVTVQSLSRNC